MCDSNTCKQVEVINPKQSKKIVMVDACIADEIQELNDKGVLTLGCCCGHGKAGQIQIYQNESGSWKEIISPPIALIDEQSIYLAKNWNIFHSLFIMQTVRNVIYGRCI